MGVQNIAAQSIDNSSMMLRRPHAMMLIRLILVAALILMVLRSAMHRDPLQDLDGEWHGEITNLSSSPRAFLIKQLLSDEECDHLIRVARPHMALSTVVDGKGGTIPSAVRTSSGTFLPQAYDAVVRRVEKRVAFVTRLPAEHQEGLQILRYELGQKYEPHFDFFNDKVNTAPEAGGQRIVTVLMYLSTVKEGGETVFPSADPEDWATGEGWSPCARQGMAVRPIKGDAVMFYSLEPDGHSTDPYSLHGSCPTERGEKWSATKWVHVGHTPSFRLFGPFSSCYLSWLYYFFII